MVDLCMYPVPVVEHTLVRSRPSSRRYKRAPQLEHISMHPTRSLPDLNRVPIASQLVSSFSVSAQSLVSVSAPPDVISAPPDGISALPDAAGVVLGAGDDRVALVV